MIQRFVCRDFRNLERIEWRPASGRQLVVGSNGTGKTSLLEALYLLATTRSFRGARPAECSRRGAPGFYLEAEVAGGRGARLGLGWTPGSGVERRVNGKAASLAEHLEVLPVVAWSEADGELLDGPPRLRRRLMDQGLVAERPATLELLARYRRALDQKRRLLTDGGGGLAAWNQLLSQAAAELSAHRRRYVDRLAAELDAVLAGGGLELGRVELRYRPSPELPAGSSSAELLAALERSRGEERRQRRPLVGPHRDDLEMRWRGEGLRRQASAGEKKLLGLALTAARGRLMAGAGRPPVYLLDDADGDLDRARLAAAWRLFEGAGQVIASSHRPEAWRELAGGARWRLEGGRLEAVAGARKAPRDTSVNG